MNILTLTRSGLGLAATAVILVVAVPLNADPLGGEVRSCDSR